MSKQGRREYALWRNLVKVRSEGRWGTFSWMSLNALLQSGNDFLAKLLDPSVVNIGRMRWVEVQRSRGIDPSLPVWMPDARRAVLLGDPGEMDASQYVLVRDLAAIPEPDLLLLMSDVVYPAGSVDAWRDAVYLPYLGLPPNRWAEAQVEGHEVEIPDWQVFATPGNHDWYDSLSGFMFNACGAERPPPNSYASTGMTASQRLARFLWRNAERPNRAALEPLRRDASLRWREYLARRDETHGPAATLSDDGIDPGAMPHQPGPYYSIDIGGERGSPTVRMVCLDTGINGSIDVGQMLWLDEQLEAGVPSILITGKPLVVDETISDFPVDGDTDPLTDVPHTVREVLSKRRNVVATVAGDIHNAQRLVLCGEPSKEGKTTHLTLDGTTDEQVRVRRLPPLQIVAGGGGAYLTPTHPTRFREHPHGSGKRGWLRLKGAEGETRYLSPDAHARYPVRRVSILGFVDRVKGKSAWGPFLIAVAALAAMVGVSFNGVPSGDIHLVENIEVWRFLAASFLGAILLLVAAPTVGLMMRAQRRDLRWWTQLVTLLLLLAGFCALAWTRTDQLIPIGIGILLVIGLPVALLAVPVLRAYPQVAKVVPWKSILAAIGAAIAAQRDVFDGWTGGQIIAGAVTVAIAGLLLIEGVKRLDDKMEKWSVENAFGWFRVLWRGFKTLIPIAIVAALVIGVPELLELNEDDQDALRFLALLEVITLVALVSVWVLIALGHALGLLPFVAPPLVALGAVGGFVFGATRDTAPGLSAALGVDAGIMLVLALIFVSASIGSFQPSDDDKEKLVGNGLWRRDYGDKVEVGWRQKPWLFRAMVIAGLPKLGEMAEATQPPFRKSFLVLDVGQREGDFVPLEFRIYGLNDERDPTAPHDPDTATSRKQGAHLVDTTVLRIPVDESGKYAPFS